MGHTLSGSRGGGVNGLVVFVINEINEISDAACIVRSMRITALTGNTVYRMWIMATVTETGPSCVAVAVAAAAAYLHS